MVATGLFTRLDVGRPTTVTVPLSCFVENRLQQWDPTKIDTPFLVLADQPFSATFSKVRWATGADDDSSAVSCNQLA